jgi:hypothetical protein
MIKKFKKFSQLSGEEKRLFLEAYVTLGKMRAAILTVSFKRLTRTLEHAVEKKVLPKLNEQELETAKRVGQAIVRASAYTPWESACLAQSLTAQKMLQKRGIPGVFYLGVAKDEESKEKMKAHAWTQCGDSIITGSRGHEAFTVVSVFGWGKR